MGVLLDSVGPGSSRCVSGSGCLALLLSIPALPLFGTSTSARELGAAPSGLIQFNRDVRPILSDNCFTCHGLDPAKRKADLRLDIQECATTTNREGVVAVKAGDPGASELCRRINSPDPKLHMPPPESGKRLKPDQIATLGRWIEQGALYQKHWAFEPPVRPNPPNVQKTDWPRNEVDRFILAALESKHLAPMPEAPRETLIRRVSLDLSGLPPTPAEVDAFMRDESAEAYEKVVDRLLASPRYGEHMARYWLDVARYGDTHGLHLDNERSMWPYRDWVVGAFNRNLPFDQFTIWQLAGDLLPDATREQRIASGFNRCNVTTSEGGAIDEEFQVRYGVDRVETTSAVWLGLTMGCAACHDHKFDPITQKEFYQVFSIFNNLAEKAMDKNALLPPPMMRLPSPDQERPLKALETELADLDKRNQVAAASLNYIDPATLTNAPQPQPRETVWIEDDFPKGATPQVNEENSPGIWVSTNEGPVLSGQRALKRSGKGLHQVSFADCTLPLTVSAGDRLFAYVFLDPNDPPKAIMLQFSIGGKWSARANWGDDDAIPYGKQGTPEKLLLGKLPEPGKWVRLEVEVSRLELKAGSRISGLAFTLFDGTAYWDKAGLVSTADPAQNPIFSLAAWAKSEARLGEDSKAPEEVKNVLKKESAKRDAADQQRLRDYFLASVYVDAGPDVLALRDATRRARDRLEAFEKDVPATMISQELEKPRPAWLLIRGQYDKHGEPVSPGVPAVLPPLPQAAVTNRLTFAKWLVDGKNPLTPRVTVNRFWQQFFGTGLVRTSEDFGTRSEWPSHPELLDWLATEFIRTGWDVKGFVRMIVTSATYRQDSRVTPKLLELDPENRLLARGPRHRLDAEVLRDNALYLSGLLNPAMGGRGVRPYQPGGIWEAVGYTSSNTAKYTQDHGDALYRRSLYLFWKRTAPPPSMTVLDAPSREQCRTRRERTDTPLQALLLMNDVTYFEAARHLGYRMLREGGATDADRLRYGFRLATARLPADCECAVLAQNLDAQRSVFQANGEAAKKAISAGDSPVPDDVPPAELAAYTMVANLLLNLDEVVTKN
jgi:hypothetical protein